ncbi:PadR family transcriptional regulator [Lentzea cavernae]|uniref:PadR family transcriptional regulator n=2 Tax=Lentzea cavernae TaxID=2020703 RepID=A0ABQ3MFE2_9PSEU|nr:PadR family transcriptional regulator [Lentzea cavernae]
MQPRVDSGYFPGMALEHAILITLEERPSSGYELARRFDRSVGHFWAATHQQIYRTLKRMSEIRWVTSHEVPGEGRPLRKVYEVTDEGRDEFVRWLSENGEPAPYRQEIAVKLRGASLGSLPTLIAEFTRHRDLHAGWVAAFRRMEQRDFPDPASLTGRRLHHYLVLSGGIQSEEMLFAWCDQVVAALERELSGTSSQSAAAAG